MNDPADRARRFLQHVLGVARAEIMSVTLPILGEQGVTKLAGTGFLFRVADESFLVTAAHVLEIQLQHDIPLYVPTSQHQAIALAGEIVRPNASESLDVAVVRLPVAQAAALEKVGYRFLRGDVVSDANPRVLPDGGYALLGYPDELSESDGGGVFGVASLYYGCTPFRGDWNDLPKMNWNPDVHIALMLEKHVKDTMTGQASTMPALRG